MPRWFGAFLVMVVGAAGCGESGGPSPDDPVTVVPGAPSPLGEAPAETSVGTVGYVTSVGASGGLVGVGTSVRAFSLSGGELVPMDVYGDAPSVPAGTGAVRAVARRTDGLFVAADSGLFYTEGQKLLLSPADMGLADLDIRGLRVTGSGPFESLAIVAADGIYEVAGGKAVKLSIDGEPGAPGAVAIDGKRLFAAYGPRLYEVDEDRSKAVLSAVDAGEIHALALGAGDALFAATDEGVVVRDAEGAYSRYTLSDGDTPAAAWDVALDPQQGMYAVTSAGVVLFAEGADPAVVAEVTAGDPPTLRVAAVDGTGTLWVGEGDRLRGLALGQPVGFAEDVAPVLADYCASCHESGAEGAPVIDFSSYEATVAKAQVMIEKMSAGLMPPADAPKKIPPDKYELVLRWYSSGQNP